VNSNTVSSILKAAIPGFVFVIAVACSGTETIIENEETVKTEQHNYSELEALYWARIDSSRLNFTDADVRFMTDMIAHHAQALIMSRLAPENNASHTVQTLAARIINAQDDEIATMQKWLRDRGQPVPLVHVDGLVLTIEMEEDHDTMDHSHMDHDQMDHADMDHDNQEMDHSAMGHDMMAHHHDMPGMLTQEQLNYLATLKGSDFDRTFLEFMIEHHLGAVIMVQELFDADGAANDNESFELASDIHAEQITEIERMRLMLSNMSD
jgi:uncharacterized protein (DUF305 family)